MIPNDRWNVYITLSVYWFLGTSCNYSSRLFEDECVTKVNAAAMLE